MTVCAQAYAHFTEVFGDEPDGCWYGPGRVNLIGEHVDYAGGLCLPMALPQVTAVAVRRRHDRLLRLHSKGFGLVDLHLDGPRATGWAAYVAGVVWALDPPGFAGADIAVVSDVPVGAGLSSSAALETAVASALADLHDLPSDTEGRDLLADACRRAENDYVGAPTGGLDQKIALHGRAGHALLLDFDDGTSDHIPFDAAAQGLTVLIIDTGTGHRLVDGQYGTRRREVDEATARLGVDTLRRAESADGLDDPVLRRRARHVIGEIGRVREATHLLREGRIRELGPLLAASHRSLRDDFEVSCLELDTAVDAATAAGALGSRMVGGGFGGAAIALCETAAVADIEAAVADAAVRNRLPAPTFLPAVPSGGARRC